MRTLAYICIYKIYIHIFYMYIKILLAQSLFIKRHLKLKELKTNVSGIALK